MKSSALRIGEVAERAGVSIDTVRYYEKRRLLPTAPRTEGGFRLFTAETVERVQFIKQAQDLGFSLRRSSTRWETVNIASAPLPIARWFTFRESALLQPAICASASD